MHITFTKQNTVVVILYMYYIQFTSQLSTGNISHWFTKLFVTSSEGSRSTLGKLC